MDTADMVKMQEQFAQSVSEFSARIVSAWADAAKSLNVPSEAARARKPDTGCQDFSAFAKTIGSPAVAKMLQEAMRVAAEDLPSIAVSSGNPEKVEHIKNKWAAFCEKSAREFLGIPEPSDTARLLDQWRGVEDYLSSAGGRTSPTPFPSLFSLTYPLGRQLPGMQDAPRELFCACADTYVKTFGGVFLSPHRRLGQDYEDRLRQAVDAQIRFLQSLPEFQGYMISASKQAAETVFARLQELGSQEMASESHKLFSASWMSAHEKMFRELFGSDSFLQTLTKTVQQGLDARTKMESVLADWPAARDSANQQDVEDLRDKLYTIEKRVRLLERELEDLKRELARPLPKRNSNDEA